MNICVPCTKVAARHPKPAGRHVSSRCARAPTGALRCKESARSTSRTIPTANTCSTMPGPMPTAARPALLPQGAGGTALHAGAGCPAAGPGRRSRREALARAVIGWCTTDAPLVAAHPVCQRCRPAGLRGRRHDGPSQRAVPLDRAAGGYRDFDDFLASLNQEKRKKIRQERRKVREAGWCSAIAQWQRHPGGRLGFLLPLLRTHLLRTRQRTLPQPRLLRPHAARHAAELAAVHRRATQRPGDRQQPGGTQ
jgi:hypothetical protein